MFGALHFDFLAGDLPYMACYFILFWMVWDREKHFDFILLSPWWKFALRRLFYFILFLNSMGPFRSYNYVGISFKRGGIFSLHGLFAFFLWIWNSTLSVEALYETPSCCIECAAVLFSLENLIRNVFQPFYLLKVVEGCVVLFIYWMVFI